MTEGKQHREFHYFLLTDYEKEEELLRKKHKSGERFVSAAIPGIYTFETCEPEDVVYRLDFNPRKKGNQESYLQLYADYGWEYIQDLNEYSYFRKRAVDADEADLEIFSDSESRLDMLKQIFMKKMIPLMAVFLLCLMPLVMRMINGEYIGEGGYFMMGIISVLFVLYVWTFIHCGIGFYRLRRKYSRGQDAL